MTFIERHNDEADAESGPNDAVASMYAAETESWGYLPNYARVFSPRPAVLDLWADLQRGVKAHTPRRLFELVTFAAALEYKSSYCALAHGKWLLRVFSPAQVQCLAEGVYDDIVTAAEAVAMRHATLVAQNASAITPSDIDALREVGWCDEQIFDITAIAAMRAFFTKVVDGLGARPDAALAELPSQLTQTLSVGRAPEE